MKIKTILMQLKSISRYEKEIIIDFLLIEELINFFKIAKALVLPSKIDRWGLVVN